MNNIQSDPVNEYVRHRIRAIRANRNLSIREAALLSNIPESSYSCLENGFYRITLLNLKKIVDVLGVGIEDVWPAAKAQEGAAQEINAFRFQEILRLSGARRGALLYQSKGLNFIYSSDLSPAERAELKELILSGLRRDWTIFSQNGNGASIHLCLKEGLLADHVKKLAGTYLNIWLATQLSKTEPKRPV
ncbi:MAG: helix-turn-helix transcriptional regulator [Acidobacteriota bacterium]